MNYEEYNSALAELASRVPKNLTKIYGVPRGGYYPAIYLANELGMRIITNESEIDDSTLVIDDLCDSGKTLSKYANNTTAAVYVKDCSAFIPTYTGRNVPAQQWIEIPDEKGAGIEDNIRRVLQHIGENPDREGLLGTPDRIARMFKEIFRGYNPSMKPKITTFDNGKDGLVYDNMVVDEGDFYSCCEHHMMPFFGHYWFAYIPNPNGKILGISKVGRVVDYCAAKLQVQERLVHDVVEMLTNALGEEYPPLGVALVMKGEHLCKTMRGARKKGLMTSSYLTGVFKENAQARNEFLSFVNQAK